MIFVPGTRLGAVSTRKVVTTGAPLTGGGAAYEERALDRLWFPQPLLAQSNHLELLIVFHSVKHFQSFLRDCHILIRTDNTTVVAYINCQSGTRCASTQTSCQDYSVEQSTPTLPTRNSGPRPTNCGNGLDVQRECSIRGPETP